MEDQSGRWWRSRKEKDEDIEDGTTGLGRFDGKSRLWRDEAGRQEKGGGSVFADPLSGASAPDSPFPPVHQQLSRSPPPPLPSTSTPEARGWFGVERQAARGR